MSLFTQFCRSYGQGTNCQAVSGETIAKYRGRLPEELLQFWQENGWCAYGNGMFWLVNPDVYSDVLPDWFDTSETPIDAIARTAFGDLFLWSHGGVQFLSVHYRNCTRICNDIGSFFDDFLCQDKNKSGTLRCKTFLEVVERLGPLHADDCYMFVPALALGGSADPHKATVGKLREHLSLLSQL